MGSTYTVRPNSLVPGAKAGAQAAYTTMPYGSAGGWQAGSQFRRELPIFGLGPIQGVRGIAGLGLAPAVLPVVGLGATAAAIGGLIALVQNAMDDDWADSEVFNSHARAIHSAMLAMQCLFGGAQTQSPLVDTMGNVICRGGTKPVCKLSGSALIEWRALRDGFATFWNAVTSSWTSFGPTNAQALRLKGYAREFHAFYAKVAPTCAKQGVSLPGIPPFLQDEQPAPVQEAPAWLKWTIGGVAVISTAVIVRYVVLAFKGA